MVTKNYARFGAAMKNVTSDGYIYWDLKIKNIGGEIENTSINGLRFSNYGILFTYIPVIFSRLGLTSFPMAKTNQLDSKSGMFFGSGTTPATEEDYKLANLIEFSSTGLNIVSSNLTQIVSEDTLYVYTYTVQNSSSEPITISESALISSIYYYSQGDKVVTFLWARDTFEPVTLQPGETRPFTMTIGLE